MSVTDVITLGIGPDSDIPHLVLTGLGIQDEPIPPDPEGPSLDPAQLIVIFNAVETEGGLVSGAIALPVRCVQIEWQTSYDAEPAVAEVFLQGSLDGLHWSNIDSTTAVAGEIRRVNTSAKFVQAMLGTITDGTLVTVKAVAKFVKLGGI